MVNHDSHDMADREVERRLLALLEALVKEIRPDRGDDVRVSLASRLDRDLGLDSLARSELLLRIEQEFGSRLPESALLAETPGTLLQLLHSSAMDSSRRVAAESVSPSHETATADEIGPGGEPSDADTLNAAMDWHLQRHPDRTHLYVYGDEDTPKVLSYGELNREAQAIAAALAARGIRHGVRIALMLPTSSDYFAAFLGILRAGAVPVPIYPPARPSQLEEHLRRHGRILSNAGAQLLITVEEARKVAHLLHADAPHLRQVMTLAELDAGADDATLPNPPDASSLALLQYTSGSTGDPKGVQLTHAQLLANIRAMGTRLEAKPDDVFVSWLPLYHDMGLIAAWLASLYYGIPLVVMSPLAFLSHPLRWLELIDRHRGTISGAPNFGYELCLRAITPERVQALDLSRWRVAFNGAEPVSATTMEQFAERLAPCGLRQESLMPVYGLAEAAVGLCVARPGRGLVIDRINRERFASSGEARPESDPAAAQPFVNCGPPLPGYALRIVDAEGHELTERQEGDLEFRGPSATSGYFDNPEESEKLYHDGWLRTGDRGYLADGDLHISGRRKDMLVRGGRNLYPYDIETAVGRLEGVRRGCVAVFGDPDPTTGSESLVVVAETRIDDPAKRQELCRAIADTVVDVVNVPADDIRLVPPHSVLKTSSGKIRRAATRDFYRQGRLGEKPLPVWRQVVKLTLRAWAGRARQGLSAAGYWAYYLYAWSLFGVGFTLFALAGLPLPRLAWRWRVAHYLCRAMARLAGIRIQVSGLEHLPRERPCVLVANHASYLDVLILTAALPCSVRYLAKEELESRTATRLPLTRMGALFVERFDPRQAEQDMQQAERAVANGNILAIFPEGTFTAEPGLGDFHMGAFLTAAHADVPVVPVAIAGSRQLLRGKEWRPHPGRVTVQISAALEPQGSDWDAALKLKHTAYEVILRHAGEGRRRS